MFLASCGSCSLTALPFAAELVPWDGDEIVLMSYNVQNLFDAADDGNEYPEYDPGEGRWGVDDYYRKLKNLSAVIRGIGEGKGPDIAVFQELEKPAVLKTLNEEFLAGLGYRFAYVAYREGQSVHVGALSRIPVSQMYSHAPDGDSRAILELRLSPPRGGDITVFVNHWKSRLGGVAATEGQRAKAAAFLAHRISAVPTPCIVCGDLNWDTRELEEYALLWGLSQDDGPPALGFQGSASPLWLTSVPQVIQESTCSNLMFNPWVSLRDSVSSQTALTPGGSYWYKGEWEAIDHCFLSCGFFTGGASGGGWKFSSFGPYVSKDFCTGDAVPIGYSHRKKEGCSDHLPVVLRLKL